MDITRSFAPSNRYEFDAKFNSSTGWAQVDTRNDCSYFGNWANPEKRQWFSYVEGDTTLVTCSSDEEFSSYVRETLDWHSTETYKAKIDCCLNTPAYRAIREHFERLGFADHCH